MVVAPTEVVPARVRTAGFVLADPLATALPGGFTPPVTTWLTEADGNRAACGRRSEAPAAPSPRA